MDDELEAELQVTTSRERGATVVAVRGELDAASTPVLQEKLADIVAEGGPIVLDLAECQFLDSTGLHAIIDARGVLEERGAGFEICCVGDGPVARVIEVALPGMIALHPSRQAALDALTA